MTTALTLTALPYACDPLNYFARLRHRPNAVLLDSGRPHAKGRFDIMASDPLAVLSVSASGEIEISADTHPHLAAPPEALLGRPFALQQWLLDQLALPALESELPFLGGLIGFWSYDLGRAQQGVASRHSPVSALPQARVGLFDWSLTLDHERQQAWLVATTARRNEILAWLRKAPRQEAPFRLTAPFAAEMTAQDYAQRFDAVKRYINAGDCYQINLAQRFSASFSGDSWQAYQRLRKATPTPFSGYLAWENQAILSVSPERFIGCRDGHVEARPIKGTRPRGKTPQEDDALARALTMSPKDRAENVMIVDLLRNDLGRVCRPGSIHVPALCALESYPNVHHLVSVVRGELTPEATPLTLMASAFPGGSITGAPKIRAMQIIDELEPCQRSAYCGSLGYIDRRGQMDTSIAIRTLIADDDRLHVWGGGGLVADSEASEEYAETYAKIRHLIGALE